MMSMYVGRYKYCVHVATHSQYSIESRVNPLSVLLKAVRVYKLWRYCTIC